MGIEIERKFLIHQHLLPPLGKSRNFQQFYLSRRPSVRVRIAGKRAWLTVKGPGSIERSEFEYLIPAKDARQMISLSKSDIINKNRYIITIDRRHWEIDEFLGHLKGLWLAEVELSSAKTIIDLPHWIDTEVTDDQRYTNAAIAYSGIPRKF